MNNVNIEMNKKALFRCDNDNTLVITDAYTEGGISYNIVIEGAGLKKQYEQHLHDTQFLLIPVIQQIFQNVAGSTKHYLENQESVQVVKASSLLFGYRPSTHTASDVTIHDAQTGQILGATGRAVRLLPTPSVAGLRTPTVVDEIAHLAGLLYQKSVLNIPAPRAPHREDETPVDGQGDGSQGKKKSKQAEGGAGGKSTTGNHPPAGQSLHAEDKPALTGADLLAPEQRQSDRSLVSEDDLRSDQIDALLAGASAEEARQLLEDFDRLSFAPSAGDEEKSDN